MAALAGGCGLFVDDEEDPCKPLPATRSEDLWSIPWVELQVPQGFCNVAAAYQYQIYSFGSVPGLAADYDGFDGEMTFPPGTRVLLELSSGGYEVLLGDESGEVCGRHFNACTEPGEYACQPLTIVAHDVFSATRNELFLYQDGALAEANGSVWLLQPRYHDGVWRMDPATFEWEQVLADFPGAVPMSGTFTGGVAIAAGTDIHYVINDRAFVFDTVARAWSAGVEIEHPIGWNASAVAHQGLLYINLEGLLGSGGGMVAFDPATRKTTAISTSVGSSGSPLQRQNTIAFARGDTIVFGGGNECDERDAGCWRQDFRILDLATNLYTDAPFVLPGFRSARGALDFDDRTVVVASDSTAWLLLDGADDFVALPRNPALASCTPPVGPPGALRQSTLSSGDRALVVGGEGADTMVTLYLK